MVVIDAPSAWAASIVQDFTDSPSTSTVHAPQLDVSQPTFVAREPARLAQVLHEQRPRLDVMIPGRSR